MKAAEAAQRLYGELGKAVVGHGAAIEQVFVAILADGHVLLEGVPGMAKTLMVRATARALSLPFTRIQFTPDLMPSDVIGTNVFDPKTVDFKLVKGPIFTGILLADEINRTPPKTQAALLEAMEERQATIDGVSYRLPFPFLVFATQNPIEYEGTYPLPEAQQDRFLLKVVLQYPAPEDEVGVLKNFHAGFRAQNLDHLEPVLNQADIEEVRAEVNAVKVEDRMFNYIYEIVKSTRTSSDIMVGASPRAGLALVSCSKALAALRGRDFVIPDDIKELCVPILRHRVLLRPEAEIEGLRIEDVLKHLVDGQTVPR